MRRLPALLFLVIGSCLLPLPAQEEQQPQEKPAGKAPAAVVAEEIAALEEEWQTAQAEFRKAYRAAETQEEKSKVFEAKYPKPEDFVGRFAAAAARAPASDAGLDALVWIVDHSRQATPALERAMKLIRQHHIESEKLGTICSSLIYLRSPLAHDMLGTLLEKSPHEDVRGRACYALGESLKRLARTARALATADEDARKRRLESLGEELAALVVKGPEPLEKRATDCFERVVEEFPEPVWYRDVTIGDRARGNLFEMKHLAVGKPAPDIVGEDIDGNAFKLSDYRGKVVMLDFWGHW